MFCWNFTWRCP